MAHKERVAKDVVVGIMLAAIKELKRVQEMTERWTVVDLFCGCGGLSLGFERAGFNIVGAYDSWGAAVETYRRNLKHPVEIAELDEATELPNASVFVGGPPCQGFSSAGRREATDQRNTLVRVFALLVARHRPLAFMFENVEGFLTQGRGRFVFDLLGPLIDAGYHVQLRKVNAAHYGVPQHRKRVIAIGGLGWDPSFPEHTHCAKGAPGATLGNCGRLPFTPTLEEGIEGLPPARARHNGDEETLDHSYSEFNDADAKRARCLKPGQRMRDLPEELWHESYKKRAYRRVRDGMATERRGGAPAGLRRLVAEEPAKAITGGALRDFVHPNEDRPLTIRECARIQTFPDDYVFVGSVSDRVQMVGNAVPVRLAESFAANLREDLDRAKKTESGGCLLSFVPTLSTGMSPVLQDVCAAVNGRFRRGETMEQLKLWP